MKKEQKSFTGILTLRSSTIPLTHFEFLNLEGDNGNAEPNRLMEYLNGLPDRYHNKRIRIQIKVKEVMQVKTEE